MADLSIERLKELLSYDPDTGWFTWRISRNQFSPAGSRAGSWATGDYWRVCVDWQMYRAHRLAWFYVYGKWPDGHLDHKNGDPGDNRIENLREATRSQNMANRALQKNTVGVKGVSRRGNKFQARIGKDGRLIYLGSFPTKEQAHAAYCEAAERLFGQFARAA